MTLICCEQSMIFESKFPKLLDHRSHRPTTNLYSYYQPQAAIHFLLVPLSMLVLDISNKGQKIRIHSFVNGFFH